MSSHITKQDVARLRELHGNAALAQSLGWPVKIFTQGVEPSIAAHVQAATNALPAMLDTIERMDAIIKDVAGDGCKYSDTSCELWALRSLEPYPGENWCVPCRARAAMLRDGEEAGNG